MRTRKLAVTIVLSLFLLSLAACSGSRAGGHIDVGNAAREAGNYQQAIAEYDQAIELDPELAIAYSNRGATYLQLGEYEQAISDCNQAIELDPDMAMAYNNRGGAYLNLREYEQALTDLSRALELDPELAIAYSNRAGAYLALEAYDQTVADSDRALELDPDLANAYAARGSAYFYMGEHERGMADLNRAIELDPNLVMAYYNRGTANLNLGEYEQAIADYERVLELTTDPDLRRMAEAELERLEGATSPAAAAPLTLHPYEHSSGAFLIHIPEDWKVLTIDDQVTTMFLDSEEEEGMMVSTFEGQSIADFAEQRVIEFMEQMEMEYEILEQQDLTEDYLYISVATLNEDWMFDFHFGEREDVGLILTLWAHEGSNFHRSWDSIVQSFIFTPGAAR